MTHASSRDVEEDGPGATAVAWHRLGRPPARPTQGDRILRALRQVGARGITATDFALPHVIDGGRPITGLAARIDELRSGGHAIDRIGTRHRCAIYCLAGDADVRSDDHTALVGRAPQLGLKDTTDVLFDPVLGAAPPRSALDPEAT